MTTTTSGYLCPPDHKHGQTSNCGVKHGCRCEDCKAFRARYQRELRKRKAYGRYSPPDRVLAEPVRQHVRELQDFGFGVDRVARLAGVSVITLRHVTHGRTGRNADKGVLPETVSRAIAEKVLGVRPDFDMLADAAFVSSRGTQRRIQALAVQGWSQLYIARRLGMDPRNANKMLASAKVFARSHRAVAALFDELWDKTPPQDTSSERSVYIRVTRHAASRGWLPALAWDDIDFDDAPAATGKPNDEVDDITVELAVAGEQVRLTPAERREAVKKLHTYGLNDQDIAKRLSCSDQTVLRARRKLGLPSNDDVYNPNSAAPAAA